MTDATVNVFEGGSPSVNGITQIKTLLGMGNWSKHLLSLLLRKTNQL